MITKTPKCLQVISADIFIVYRKCEKENNFKLYFIILFIILNDVEVFKSLLLNNKI